jgi:hypothetical protein
MKQAAGLCAAAAFACVATVAAQGQTSSTASQTTRSNAAPHDVTLTGCLAKGADGGYTLDNARVDVGASSTTSSTTTPGATSTTGTAGATTTGGAATTTAASAAGGVMNAPAMTWTLAGGSDLASHVGHKVQVSGKTSWDTSMDHARTSAPGATGTGGAPTTTAGTSPTAGGTTTTASGARGMRDEPRVDVQSVKMISSSCS